MTRFIPHTVAALVGVVLTVGFATQPAGATDYPDPTPTTEETTTTWPSTSTTTTPAPSASDGLVAAVAEYAGVSPDLVQVIPNREGTPS